jgi:outer membrane protein, multidrug efflux system
MKLFKYTILILCFTACKVPKIAQQKSNIEIPSTFISAIDTTNVANINWKNYFIDQQLQQLIDTALKNNFDMLIASQNIEMAKANVIQQKGMLLPTVNTNTAFNLRKFGNYTMDWAGNKTTEIIDNKIVPQHLPDYFIGFQANWEIDLWGKLKNAKQSAQARLLATSQYKNFIQANVISEIAANYIQLITAKELQAAYNQNMELLNQSLKTITIQKEANKATDLAVKQYKAQILNAQNSLVELNQMINGAEVNINTLLARFQQSIGINVSSIEQIINQNITVGSPKQLLQNRPDILAAEQELLAANFDILVAQKAFYPSFNINNSIGLQSFSPSLLFNLPSVAYNFLGGLSAPLLNKSALKAAFKTASAIQLNALCNYNKTIVNAYNEVSNLLITQQNLQQSLTLKTQEVEELTNAINAATLLYQANRATYLEVLTAQQNLLQASTNKIEIKNALLQNAVNIYKALGYFGK